MVRSGPDTADIPQKIPLDCSRRLVTASKREPAVELDAAPEPGQVVPSRSGARMLRPESAGATTQPLALHSITQRDDLRKPVPGALQRERDVSAGVVKETEYAYLRDRVSGPENLGQPIKVRNLHRSKLSRFVFFDGDNLLQVEGRPMLAVRHATGGAPDALSILWSQGEPIGIAGGFDDVEI